MRSSVLSQRPSSSATLVGRTLAPILGGAILSVFAALSGCWNYRLVYVAAFILAIPVFVLSFLMPGDASSESGIKSVTLRDFGSSLHSFISNGRLLGTALVEMASYFTYGAFETYLPLYLLGKGLPPYQIGFIFSLQILAIALIPVVSGIAAATAIGIVFGVGLSFSTVATSSYASDVAAKEDLGVCLACAALFAVLNFRWRSLVPPSPRRPSGN